MVMEPKSYSTNKNNSETGYVVGYLFDINNNHSNIIDETQKVVR